jgi:predicted  nucleic acid-binding Zn-ribbon protein
MPYVIKRYSTIRMRRGLAVVSVKNGTCQGCNMNIPPQLYNTLQRGNSLELCPNCNRIIYWARLLEEVTESP